ncbi:hypothetical protein KY360_02935 [Candidatus Woesearchaeota archaeon]|nr:hypothetical protein [Candidatus Woesearchaeota archaeon]
MATIKEIKNYLGTNIKKGFKEEDLVNYLISTGVSKEDISKAQEELRAAPILKPYYRGAVIAASALIMAVIVFSILQLGKTVDCGFEKECFIKQANRCQPAILRESVIGTTIVYTTENCMLTKGIQRTAPSESRQVETIFKGKTMQCPYEKDNFNPLLVESIITSTEECTGELKVALNEIRIVRYELKA